MKKKILLWTFAIITVAALTIFLALRNIAKAPAVTKKTTIAPTTTTKPVEDIAYPVTLSMDEASSLTVVVNKKHKLAEDYVPALTSIAGYKMHPEAAVELQKLLDDAANAGNNLKIISAYRSYQTQVSTYNGYVNQYGQAQADTFSARPGHSEHQTGLAVDLGNVDGSCALEICFGDSNGGKWLSVNAESYGFIIRYPEGKELDTGYQYEPWHLRFVGVELAKKINSAGKTLDQYYDVVAGDY